ncbi:MAG: GNAT family protein [Chloroflexota bacterium]
MSTLSPFHGNSILLRPFEPEDIATLHTYINHPDLMGRRYLSWGTPDFAPLSKKQVGHVYESWSEDKNALHLAVVLKDGEHAIGHAECDWGWDTLCPSLSVVIAPARQRNGYGSEVMRLLLHYAFEYLPGHSVACWVADWNEAGRALLKAHGFAESGRMRRAGIRQGRYFDMITADLLRPEWLNATVGQASSLSGRP